MSDEIKVYPLSDAVKKNLGLFSHPSKLPLRLEGSMWPLDEFTSRRLRDGDITTDAPADVSEAAPASKVMEASATETNVADDTSAERQGPHNRTNRK